MKKVLILTTEKNENKEKFIKLLGDKLQGKVEFEIGLFDELTFVIEKGNVDCFLREKDMTEFDFIYLRSKSESSSLAKTVAIYLDHKKINYADRAHGASAYLGDKLTSLVRLAIENMPVESTVYSTAPGSQISRISSLGFPLIIKDLKSQRMTGVYVVSSNEDLLAFLEKNKQTNFVFQKFIDIKQEYRILVTGGKAGSVHTKTKRNYELEKITYEDENEWHHFIDLSSVPSELLKIAEDSAGKLKLDIAGVDVCEDTRGNFFVIEVNRGPGIDYEAERPDEINALASFFESSVI